MIKLLAISGSLRANSTNTLVLQAAKALAPDNVDIFPYSELAQLPHFNPDLDCNPLPIPVISLKEQIQNSDGIIISSPEYAHGVPGSLKNALDWLVSSVEFPGKPVMLINTNPRASIAQKSLQEILITMSAKMVDANNLTLAIAGRKLNVQEIVADSELSASLIKTMSNFVQAVTVSQ